MLKRDFIERVRGMKAPVISEDDPGFWDDLISTQFEVSDSAPGVKNEFRTPTVKLTQREWASGSLDGYYARVEKARQKYNRWLREVVDV